MNTLLKAFRIEGSLEDCVILGDGLVNETIRVEVAAKDKTHSYVFQKINSFAYKNPEAIMHNIKVVNAIVSEAQKTGQFSCTIPLYLNSVSGENYYLSPDGEFWRVMPYIPSVCFDKLSMEIKKFRNPQETKKILLHGMGEAYGSFAAMLKNADISQLNTTVADFHNTPKRLETLFATCRNLDFHSEEILYLKESAEKACRIYRDYEKGLYSLQVTHNDTKLSNVLFEKDTLRPLAVIDLDTLMPGLLIYDFADAARSICKDYHRDGSIFFSEENFRLFKDSYLSYAGDFMTEREKDNLRLAVFSISIELASRYILDYIHGNNYFRASYPLQNLDKARELIAFTKSMNI